MKQPTLFDVPKDAPSREQLLAAFKQQHGIETHQAKGWTRKELPWMAVHLPTARTAGYGVTAESDLFDCVAKVGRLLEESGVLTYGETERAAVEALCGSVGIPFAL